MFSDFSYYALGVADNAKRTDTDKGANEQYLFRTPSLRNADLTAPYMHNGAFQSLEQVIVFYDKGGGAGMGSRPGFSSPRGSLAAGRIIELQPAMPRWWAVGAMSLRSPRALRPSGAGERIRCGLIRRT